MDGFDAAHVLARADEPLNGGIRHQKAECAARGRQKKALDQVLAQQAPAAATKCRANRQFFSPGCAARDKKTGYVQARDQKNAKRRNEQHVQGGLDVSDHVIEQGPAVRGFADERVIQTLIVQLAYDDGELRFGLLLRYSRFQTANGHVLVLVQSLDISGGFLMINRRPKLHVLFRIGKPRRHDADDGVGLRIEVYCLIHDGRIASEASFPQSPTENNRRISGWLIVCAGETSAQRGLHTKGWE